MLGDILNLAGVQSGGDDKGPQPDGLGSHDDHLTGEPPEGSHRGAGDIQSALAAIDQAQAGPEMPGVEDEDVMNPDAVGGMAPDIGDMADDVRGMADELKGKDKEDP